MVGIVVVVDYKPVVLKQFEPEGELIAGGAAGEEGGDKPEVLSGTGAEFGAGAVEEDEKDEEVGVGGAWPEAVAESGPAAAGGEDGVGAVGKPLHSY